MADAVAAVAGTVATEDSQIGEWEQEYQQELEEKTEEEAPQQHEAFTQLVEIRYYGIREHGIDDLASAEVVLKINKCVSDNKQIWLDLIFPARFDATGAMQNAIVENSRHIKKIRMCNSCNEQAEHRRCFNFFTRIVRGIIGNRKHLTYISDKYKFDFELEQTNQLADALRSNNNNNGSIESFDFDEPNLTPVTFQPLWVALLHSSVRKIKFANYDDSTADPPIHNNNNSINFTRMAANESLKELDLNWFDMRKEEYQNLFNSIKKNKGLEILKLDYDTYMDLSEEMKKLFEEMMCENTTLLDCILDTEYTQGEDVQDGIFELIQFHTNVNRMWKRYMMQREREKKTPTVITRTVEGDNNNNNNEEEEERKKKLKMRLLFRVFHQKTVLRDTILFHLLSDYPDDLLDTSHFRNQR